MPLVDLLPGELPNSRPFGVERSRGRELEIPSFVLQRFAICPQPKFYLARFTEFSSVFLEDFVFSRDFELEALALPSGSVGADALGLFREFSTDNGFEQSLTYCVLRPAVGANNHYRVVHLLPYVVWADLDRDPQTRENRSAGGLGRVVGLGLLLGSVFPRGARSSFRRELCFLLSFTSVAVISLNSRSVITKSRVATESIQLVNGFSLCYNLIHQ